LNFLFAKNYPKIQEMLVALGSFSYKYFTTQNLEQRKGLERHIKVIMSRIDFKETPAEVLMNPIPDCICYSIFSEAVFSMCFFKMRRFHEMPLHDHPDMVVFFKLLRGELLVSTYEEVGDGVCKKISRIITADHKQSFFILQKGGPTMHSFICLSEDAVFLDIIGLPYNDTDRKCTYYSDSTNKTPVTREDTQQKYSEYRHPDGRVFPLDMVELVKITPIDIDYPCHTARYEFIS
jgi:hypothetical protein